MLNGRTSEQGQSTAETQLRIPAQEKADSKGKRVQDITREDLELLADQVANDPQLFDDIQRETERMREEQGRETVVENENAARQERLKPLRKLTLHLQDPRMRAYNKAQDLRIEAHPDPEKKDSLEHLLPEMRTEIKHLHMLMEMGLVDVPGLNESLETCQIVTRSGSYAYEKILKLYQPDVISDKTGSADINPRRIEFRGKLKKTEFPGMTFLQAHHLRESYVFWLTPLTPKRIEALPEEQRDEYKKMSPEDIQESTVAALSFALALSDTDLSVLEPLLRKSLENQKKAGESVFSSAMTTAFLPENAPETAEWARLLQGKPSSPEQEALQQELSALIDVFQYRSGRRLDENRPDSLLFAAHLRIGMEQSRYLAPEASNIALERMGAVLRSRLESFSRIYTKIQETGLSPRIQKELDIWMQNNIQNFLRTLKQACELAEESPSQVFLSGETPSRVRDSILGKFLSPETPLNDEEQEARLHAFGALSLAYENVLKQDMKNRKDTV